MKIDQTHTINRKYVGQWLYTFWQYNVYADIRRGSLGRGRKTTVGSSPTAIISGFCWLFLRKLYTAIRRPSSAFQWSKMNDLEWLFRVKFGFRASLAASDVRLQKNNCVKTDKDRHILSAAKIFGRDSGFWQYKVYADIRSGYRKITLKDSGVAR